MPSSTAVQSTHLNFDLQIIADFVAANEGTMWEEVEKQGGWEGWARKELCDSIGRSGVYFEPEREQHVYKALREKIDIWAEPMDSFGRSIMAIELKCEGQYQDLRAGDFVKRVTADIKKVKAGLHPGKHATDNVMVYVIGFTTNAGDLRGWDEVAQLDEQIGYFQPGSGNFFVVWWGQYCMRSDFA